MHVTFGRVSAWRWETTSYQPRDSEAVAFNRGYDCDSERVLHINLSRQLSFTDNVIHYYSVVIINICPFHKSLCDYDDKVNSTLMFTVAVPLFISATVHLVVSSSLIIQTHTHSDHCIKTELQTCITTSDEEAKNLIFFFFWFELNVKCSPTALEHATKPQTKTSKLALWFQLRQKLDVIPWSWWRKKERAKKNKNYSSKKLLQCVFKKLFIKWKE